MNSHRKYLNCRVRSGSLIAFVCIPFQNEPVKKLPPTHNCNLINLTDMKHKCFIYFFKSWILIHLPKTRGFFFKYTPH